MIDLAYVGSARDVLALATNAEDLRLISLDITSPDLYFGADLALLKGHSEIIITIAIDWSGHWLATGAKDNTARLWRLDPEQESYECYTTFTGHAESIGAVALPSTSPQISSKEHSSPLNYPPKFLITGSQDKTIKRWDINTTANKAPRVAYTRKAHDKDINAIATSYSSTTVRFCFSGSHREDLGCGDWRGHRCSSWP